MQQGFNIIWYFANTDDYELNGLSYRPKMLKVELIYGFLPDFAKNIIDWFWDRKSDR